MTDELKRSEAPRGRGELKKNGYNEARNGASRSLRGFPQNILVSDYRVCGPDFRIAVAG